MVISITTLYSPVHGSTVGAGLRLLAVEGNRTLEGGMAYVIAEPCIGVKDTACIDVCPCDCIHPRKDEAEFSAEAQLYIDPDDCVDCGACVPACPASAIYPAADLPERWERFATINAGWYVAKTP